MKLFTSKPHSRLPVLRRSKLYRPRLEALEVRLQPGDTILGWLAGLSLAGAAPVVDPGAWPAENDIAEMRLANPGPAPSGLGSAQEMNRFASALAALSTTSSETQITIQGEPFPQVFAAKNSTAFSAAPGDALSGWAGLPTSAPRRAALPDSTAAQVSSARPEASEPVLIAAARAPAVSSRLGQPMMVAAGAFGQSDSTTLAPQAGSEQLSPAGQTPLTPTQEGQTLLRQFNAKVPFLVDVNHGHPLGITGAPAAVREPSTREFTGPDCAQGVAVGLDNIAYVVGWMTNPAGSTSAFVARVDPNCNILCVNIIPNFFGLPGPDCAYGVAVGPDKIAYVVGCMANPAATTSAFVARVDPNCNVLCVNIIPNLFGLPGPDCAYGVAVTPDNLAYVVGCMANPAATTSAFVARVDPQCNVLCVSIIPNLFGLPGPDCAEAVAIGPDSLAYVVGWMTNPAGTTTSFVAIVTPQCNILCVSPIKNVFGLPGPDCAYGVAVGPDKFAYVVGCMTNPAATTSAHVARVDPQCNVLCVSIIPNLFGLPGPDCARAVSVGPDNLAYVVGWMTNPAGTTTSFVARVDPNCNILCVNDIPNFFGLLGPDCAFGVAVGPDKLAYVVGCMANPFGFTSAFAARVDPVCNVLCENTIPNFFGL